MASEAKTKVSWFVLMKNRLFEVFAGMIDGTPAKAIIRAVELERWMLEDDLRLGRVSAYEETTASVLCFCQFVNAVIHGGVIPSVKLPVAHVVFYRKTVMRLIEVGALPHNAKGQFDETFSSAFSKETLAI